jgi:hypothetical protein
MKKEQTNTTFQGRDLNPGFRTIFGLIHERINDFDKGSLNCSKLEF